MRLSEQNKPAATYDLYFGGRAWYDPNGEVRGGFMRDCGGNYDRDETIKIGPVDNTGGQLTFTWESIFYTRTYPGTFENAIIGTCTIEFVRVDPDVTPTFPECGRQ